MVYHPLTSSMETNSVTSSKDLGLGVTTKTVEEVRIHAEIFRDI